MVTYIHVVACLFLTAISSCVALDYTVGDSAGWALGVDFSSWSAGKIFNVGDNLVFAYGPEHTVAEVSLEEYASCTAGDSIYKRESGSTEIPLKTPGTHYFICAVSGHCADGMKLAITVSIPGGSATTTPPGTGPPTPPAGGLATPQTIYSDAPATPLSHGALAVLFLLLGINQY